MIRQHTPLTSKSCCVNNMNVGTKYSHVTSMSSPQQSNNLYKRKHIVDYPQHQSNVFSVI